MERIKRFFRRIFGGSEPEPEVSSTPLENLPRPVIGISGASGDSKSVAAMVTQLRAVGAEPVFIGEHAARSQGSIEAAVARDLARIDALVVMGNDGDIDPRKYGAAKHEKTKIETDLSRAMYEEAAIKKALELKLPLLGICGGMQRLNVMDHAECGGTLHQHVPDIVGDNHHAQGDEKIPPFVPVQYVQVIGETKLSEIAGALQGLYTPQHNELPPGVVMENSFHHQAVDKLHKDFRASAVSDDGIIEAMEPKAGGRYDGQFVLGVQFHPEFGASDLGPKIAARVASEAREFARSRPRQQEVAPDITQDNWQQQVLSQRQKSALHR